MSKCESRLGNNLVIEVLSLAGRNLVSGKHACCGRARWVSFVQGLCPMVISSTGHSGRRGGSISHWTKGGIEMSLLQGVLENGEWRCGTGV